MSAWGGSTLLALSCSNNSSPSRPAARSAAAAAPDTAFDPIPTAELEGRIERLRSLLARERHSALILESGPSLEYFSGIRWGRSERPLLLVITSGGDPVVVAPAFELERARQQFKFALDARAWEEHESPFQLVAQALGEQNNSDPVAIEGTTRLFIFSGLRSAMPGRDFQDGSRLVESLRMRKSALELDSIRSADRITKQAFATAFKELNENMLEEELAGRISAAHSSLGARGGAMVLFGPSSALPHGSRERRRLRTGEVVLADGGCTVRGYNSDVTRSVVFGPPSDLQKRVWDLVLKAQTAAIEAIRPGVTCGELDRIARQVIEDGGYGPGYRFLTHRLGHGVGLEGHEAPYVVRDNPTVLEPGMVFSVEPGIYLPGQWGIRTEDVVAVTEGGCEVFGNRVRALEDPLVSA